MRIEEKGFGAGVQHGNVILTAIVCATVGVVRDISPVLAEAVLKKWWEEM